MGVPDGGDVEGGAGFGEGGPPAGLSAVVEHGATDEAHREALGQSDDQEGALTAGGRGGRGRKVRRGGGAKGEGGRCMDGGMETWDVQLCDPESLQQDGGLIQRARGEARRAIELHHTDQPEDIQKAHKDQQQKQNTHTQKTILGHAGLRNSRSFAKRQIETYAYNSVYGHKVVYTPMIHLYLILILCDVVVYVPDRRRCVR